MTTEPAWPVLFTLLGVVAIVRTVHLYRIPRRKVAASICVTLLFLDWLIISALTIWASWSPANYLEVMSPYELPLAWICAFALPIRVLVWLLATEESLNMTGSSVRATYFAILTDPFICALIGYEAAELCL